ncbi:hypothetical protein N7478_004452 [Penicillium angulare]|uniref:uncharacterized protein n=1 Tax=Penicillium angulare TaxID=116970 RepID=UPI00253FB65C|nr:uncharacterized protein N7478_004452 [Penicillium angulare]KAJ5279080.1 hypothetical protein N7478_004452 [Penicillium angulare]
MAVRRSARLRTQASPDSDESSPQPDRTTRLFSVEERDETSSNDQPIMRTPVTKKSTQIPHSTQSYQKVTEARTPTGLPAVRPSLEDMHPSKAHQSTTKKVDSGLLLGFNPIKKDANGNVVKDGVNENTPSKTKPSPAASQYGTPGYEFKFGQESQLSDQAKQLMDRIREEAKQTRAKMALENSNGQEEETHETQVERKIAKPRGQAGRFSDVHMAEFKKMDSIANHASSFRASPGKFQPVTKSLKRTKSKAQLDEPEPQNSSPSRSSSSAKRSAVPTPTATATAKRAKPNPTDDAPEDHPENGAVLKLEEATPKKAATPKANAARPRSTIRSSLMTPTRASMARSASVSLSLKAPKTSLIPSLARSPTTQALASPRTPRTEFNPRFKSNLPSISNLKSILRRRQPLFSRDPAKIAAGTHAAAPDFNPDLLFAGQAESTGAALSPSPKKHVEFTPSVKSRHQLLEKSPSRSKIPTTPSRSNLSEIFYPTLPTLTPERKSTAEDTNDNEAQSPTIRHVRKSEGCDSANVYPELPVVAHGISHGLSNKKRRRSDVDDDDDVPNAEDTENVPPADAQPDERSTKRMKANPPTPSPVKSRPIKTPVRSVSGRVGNSASASAKKRPGMLSLSRLNMLSKPKGRA